MLSRLAGLSAVKYAAVVALLALLFVCYQRGSRMEFLELQLASLTSVNTALMDDNYRLEKAAGTVSEAAQGQCTIQQVEQARQIIIEQITDAPPASKPEDAIDEQSSRQAVTLLNNDLFAPLGSGLRRADGRAAAGHPAVPASSPAAHEGAERR